MNTNTESYVTKANPNADDWLAFNGSFFAVLQGETPEGRPRFATFTDVDVHATKAKMTTEAFFEEICEKVGPLGKFALHLVQAPDNAWHITIGPAEAN